MQEGKTPSLLIEALLEALHLSRDLFDLLRPGGGLAAAASVTGTR